MRNPEVLRIILASLSGNEQVDEAIRDNEEHNFVTLLANLQNAFAGLQQATMAEVFRISGVIVRPLLDSPPDKKRVGLTLQLAQEQHGRVLGAQITLLHPEDGEWALSMTGNSDRDTVSTFRVQSTPQANPITAKIKEGPNLHDQREDFRVISTPIVLGALYTATLCLLAVSGYSQGRPMESYRS